MSHPHPPAHAPTHPSAAPPTVSPPPYLPLNWSFPFSPSGKDDATDPFTYMKALGLAEDGFFPLGLNGMWHGGIHFGAQTANALNQSDGVRAIADGEVVAYRLDSKYPELDYPDKRYALYSTGFVLIRHRLPLPPAPKARSTAPTSTLHSSSPPPTPPVETLTFFSFYMHTLDWASYQAAMQQADAGHLSPMRYWEGDRYYRVGSRAKDKQSVPVPRVLHPGEQIDRDLLTEFIEAGFVVPPPEPSVRHAPLPPPAMGLHVRSHANGRIVGLLPTGSEVIVTETAETAKNGWAQIKSIKRGQVVGPVVGTPATPNAPWGWVYLKELEPVFDPKPLDTVVVLKTPRPVKAGEVIAHMGQYLRSQDASPLPPKPTRPIVHLEVFAGSDLPAFIEKSRARAKEGPDDAKPFLEIAPGALLVTDLPAADQTLERTGLKLVPIGDAQRSRWIKVQPKTITMPAHHHGHTGSPHETAYGPPLWVENQYANSITATVVQGWKDFPLDVSNAKGPGTDFRDVFRRVDLDKQGATDSAKDEQGRRWWNVTVGTKDGGTRQGWVREKDHPLVRLCGPWDWPGFELADHTDFKPVEMFKRYLYVADLLLSDEDPSAFEPSAIRGNASDLITKLEKAIDRNHDGKVTAQELAQAQQTPWMAEAISHLVVRCESEWGGGLGKWAELTPVMNKLAPRWTVEMERIGKLQWWEQVKGVEGFPAEPMAWHFHPIGLIGNFSTQNITLEEARVRAFLRMIRVGEGTEGSEGYERLFGGESFIRNYGRDFSDHPRILISRTNSHGRIIRSTAAGAYQVMGYTWDDPTFVNYRHRYAINDFTPVSQDRFCVILLKFKRHAINDIKKGNLQSAIFDDGCNNEWASLPGDVYGQGGVSMSTATNKFLAYLDDEPKGKSDLAVPIGGLNDLIG